MLAIKRASQSFPRCVPGMLIGKFRRNHDTAGANMFKKLFPRFRAASVQILIGDPPPIERPTKIRLFPDQAHCLVDRLGMKLSDFRGVIGETNIEMLVRYKCNGPLFRRHDRRGCGEFSEAHLSFSGARPLRHFKNEPRLAKLVCRREWSAE